MGKSSIIRAISTGTPEVNNYPFTTRGMTLGHVYDNVAGLKARTACPLLLLLLNSLATLCCPHPAVCLLSLDDFQKKTLFSGQSLGRPFVVRSLGRLLCSNVHPKGPFPRLSPASQSRLFTDPPPPPPFPASWHGARCGTRSWIRQVCTPSLFNQRA